LALPFSLYLGTPCAWGRGPREAWGQPAVSASLERACPRCRRGGSNAGGPGHHTSRGGRNGSSPDPIGSSHLANGGENSLLAQSSHGRGTTGAPPDVAAVQGHRHADRSSVPRSTSPAFPQSKKGDGGGKLLTSSCQTARSPPAGTPWREQRSLGRGKEEGSCTCVHLVRCGLREGGRSGGLSPPRTDPSVHAPHVRVHGEPRLVNQRPSRSPNPQCGCTSERHVFGPDRPNPAHIWPCLGPPRPSPSPVIVDH
jgi:hypothetical protein